MREAASNEAGGNVADRRGPSGFAWSDQRAQLCQIPVERIAVPRRPTRRFLGDIAALAESMQDFGLQQPISVRRDGDHFILTSGMRRLAAAKTLQWSTIPAFVRDVSADQAYVLDLIENLQRQDLSAEEEADAFGELIRTRHWTLQQVADTVKRSVGYVSKRVRLFEDSLLREAITTRSLAVSTAEELLAAAPDMREKLIERALAERWDQVSAREVVRALEQTQELDLHLAPNSSEPNARFAVDDDQPKRSRDASRRRLAVAGRPRGFTRAIREFHRLINELQAQDLTPSDRAALRALFRDLLILARSPIAARPPTFPPLPRLPASRRRSR